MSWAGISSDVGIAGTDVDPPRSVNIDGRDDGTADVTLTVTDRGDPDSCGPPGENCSAPESAGHVIRVTVNNVPPTIALSGAANGDEGAVYTLNLGPVTDPGDDTVSQYIVHWGDNTSDVYDSAGEVTHAYPDGPESYVINVDLVDEDGTHTDAGSLTVDVENVAPTVALAGPSAVDEQDTRIYSFSSSDPGDDTFTLVGKSCGVNGILSNVTFDTSAGAGSFECTFPDGFAISTVSVEVADSDGAVSNTDTLGVVVNNVAPDVEAGNGQTASEGSLLELDPSTFSDSGFDFPPAETSEDFTATVDWGDETPTELSGVTETPGDAVVDTTGTVSGSHVYADDGDYTLTVCVTDDDTGTGCDTLLVTLTNVEPTAEAGGPYLVDEGSSLVLSGSASDPGLADVLTFAWDLDNDGEFDDSSEPDPTFDASLLDGPGLHTVVLQVCDDDGACGTSTTTVNVSNVAPSVTVDNFAEAIEEGQLAVNSGIFSDPGDDVVSVTVSIGTVSQVGSQTGTWSWQFDDADGPNDGQSVVVTATDSDGDFTSATFDLVVDNVAPTATLDAPTAVDEGDPINLSLSDPFDPSSDDTAAGFSYGFDCGDGGGFGAFGSSSSTSCPTTDNGTLTVRGKIQDKDGGTSEFTTTVATNNVAPTATFEAPIEVNQGGVIRLSLVNSFDPSSADTAAGFSYAFDCGDGAGFGAFGASTSINCPATDDGLRTVRGKIQDKDGGTSEYAAAVFVNPILPLLEILESKADAIEGKLDSLEGKADGLQDSIDDFSGTVGGLGRKADALEGKADSIEAKADSIEAKADAIEVKLDSIEAKADSINAKADSIEAKAVNIKAKTDSIEAKADSIEAKIDSLKAKADSLEAKADAIEAKGDALEGKADTIQDSVDEVAGGIDAVEAKADSIEAKADALEAKIDEHIARSNEISENFTSLVENVVAMERVHVQVIQLNGGGNDDNSSDDKGKSVRFLLYTAEGGTPVDVALVSVMVSDGKAPVSFQDVTGSATSSSGGTGKIVVNIELPKNQKKAKIFKFNVEHDHGIDPIIGPVVHVGSSTAHTSNSKNLGTGQ